MSYRDELMSQALNIKAELRQILLDNNKPLLADKLDSLDIRWNQFLRRTAGRANRSFIELSWPIFSNPENKKDFKETVIHEFAHSVIGPRHGHNALWKYTCLRLGGNGRRCHSMMTPPNIKRRIYRYASCARCQCAVPLPPKFFKRLLKGEIQIKHTCGELVIPHPLDVHKEILVLKHRIQKIEGAL